jgi:REP element-mobilizing transposase RayT
MTAEEGRSRRSIRLKDFDYTAGALYFLTICSDRRRCIFGRVEEGRAWPNALGRMIEDEWLRSLEMRRHIDLDACVIMPNHFHAIVALFDQGARSAPLRGKSCREGMQAKGLASLVAGFKAAVTRRASHALQRLRLPIWQRNYYEHVVRDERDLERIRAYIEANPARWEEDSYHPRSLAEAGEGARIAPLRAE